MRERWRTRRRAVGIAFLVVLAMLVAVLLARGAWPGPRDETTKKKSRPRRDGPFTEGGGEDRGLGRGGDETKGEFVGEGVVGTSWAVGPNAGDSGTVGGTRRDRGGEAETPRGGESVSGQGDIGVDYGNSAGEKNIDDEEFGFGRDGSQSTTTSASSWGVHLWEPRTREARSRWRDETEKQNRTRRRLIDPGEGDAIQNDQNQNQNAGDSCVAACGLCRASCCCDSDCSAVGDCCFDFTQPDVCVEQKTTSPPPSTLFGDTGAPPPPASGENASPPSETNAPPEKTPSPNLPPPFAPNAPALPETTLTWPPSPAVFTSPPEEELDKSPPPPPPPVTETETETVPSPPPPPPPGFFPGTGSGTVISQGLSSVDPRGVWHSNIKPPTPMFPSLPPAPFPPLPGVPPLPLGVFAKLQAVPRCAPFCNTRAPTPSLPKGDRHWPVAVAVAAEKQWAQIKDLAQIQIGGSADPKPYTNLFVKSQSVKGQGGVSDADDSDDFFFTTGLDENAELKKHMRRASSWDEGLLRDEG